MEKLSWCETFVFLRGRPLRFSGRPYLPAVYNSPAQRIVLRCSRQVEKTTFLCNTVVHACCTYPHLKLVVVFPRREQALVFAKSRLWPLLVASPVIGRLLLGTRPPKMPVSHLRFNNGAEVYIRAAYHSADAVRGIDADYLLVDEFQDIAPGDLPVLEEMLSHSVHRRVFLTGTPKTVDNHLEFAFGRSTAHEWRVPCDCGQRVLLDEHCLEPQGPICPDCAAPLAPERGVWVPRNPDSTWGDGFTLNHLATPWLDYRRLWENFQTYNPATFRNECLGLPTCLGDHIVTRAEVEACCGNQPMARSLAALPGAARRRLVAGIDWGGGAVSRTVLVLGYMLDDDHFHAVHLVRYGAREEPDAILTGIAEVCQRFQVQHVAADGNGNGAVYNNLLLDRLPSLARLLAIHYAACDQAPRQYKGRLWHWNLGRTPSLGMVFTRIKKGRLHLPCLTESASFVNEIWIEVAEYDSQQRAIRYTHAETQPDDTLHALNYASTLARYWMNRRMERGY